MVSKRKFFSIVIMMVVLLFLTQFSMVLRDQANQYDANASLSERKADGKEVIEQSKAERKDLSLVISEKSVLFIGDVSGAMGTEVKRWADYVKWDMFSVKSMDEYIQSKAHLPEMIILESEKYAQGEDLDCLERFQKRGAIIVFGCLEDPALIENNEELMHFLGISKVISEKEKKITAYNESGHALLFHLLPDVGPVHTVSIIPTGGGAAGYTMPLPERDEMFDTKGRMLQQIIVSLGGRVAEELIFDDITTGASQDIKQATELAKAMVTKYGFSENVGLINYNNDDDEVFIGRDLAHTRGYGEGVASKIDEEVKRIIDECYAKARAIIQENSDVLHKSADLLLEKEKIGRDEFEALFQSGAEVVTETTEE